MVRNHTTSTTMNHYTDFSQPKGEASIPEFSLSEESRHVLKNILQTKSRDGDGVIDVDELGECLEAFGFSPDDEDVDFLKAHFDDNGDGELEVNELMDNIDVINWHCFYGKELMDEFTRIDRDKDRFIRFPEMLSMLTTMGPEPLPAKEARQLLDKLARKYDENFDGKFSYSEFVKIYMSDELPFRHQLQAGITPSATKVQPSTDKKPKKKIIKKKSSVVKDDATSASVTPSPSSHPASRGGATRPLTSKSSSDRSTLKSAAKSRSSDLASKSKTTPSTSSASGRSTNGSASSHRVKTANASRRSTTKT